MVDTFLMRLPVASGMKEQAQRAGKSERWWQAQRLVCRGWWSWAQEPFYSRQPAALGLALVTQGGPLCHAQARRGLSVQRHLQVGLSVDGRWTAGLQQPAAQSPPSVEMEPNQALRPAGS